jgi:hypothetical protein
VKSNTYQSLAIFAGTLFVMVFVVFEVYVHLVSPCCYPHLR